jgi:hypothetical protein
MNRQSDRPEADSKYYWPEDRRKAGRQAGRQAGNQKDKQKYKQTD